MATQPLTLPEWASNEEFDPVTGAANKVEPTPSYKGSGLLRNEALIRSYLNYELDLIAEWVNYYKDSHLEGTESLSGGSVAVVVADQTDTSYKVMVTPSANVGNVWVTKDSSTQFTINTSTGVSQSVDWVLTNR